MKVDEAFGDYHILSDEGTIRLSGKVLIQGTEEPHVTVKVTLDLLKVSVFCAVSKAKLYGPFFFAEAGTTLRHAVTMAVTPVKGRFPRESVIG